MSETIDLTRTYNQRSDMKPIGLWYAMDNDWLKWVRAEQMPWVYPNDFILKLDKTDILVLDTIQAFQIFNSNYGIYNGYMTIDWIKVAEKYKGVEIPNYDQIRHYNFEFFDTTMMWTHTWDVKSGCIWDLSAIVSIEKL